MLSEIDLDFHRSSDGDFFSITVPPAPAQVWDAMMEADRLGFRLVKIEGI